ncbi:osteoclast-stimulating factor 1 [Salpingoeca rosetta]|uniref:Osteoclast-stimulating factor 1 n=1 Tax=Salpingoeca rosetta (strain ATCC 50818 / BSB-021) TaxID=946362 RepID=F2URJ3_SALR5|nr:osteoclast-stimulating factor 1 [Salpingoeca rosetta]EGD80162.1 osteoclast-stimulating factor 1 [Salpingoeca rosetta]|eukprot:XP_004988224.1 osteoclast-stimulating factor 1 [Salpingoeca rosetta]
MPPPKPPAPAKPGKVSVYRALYPYTAQHADELSFEEGDLIYVQKQVGFEKSGNTESVDNPLHEAAKRGNLPFLIECLTNGVSPNALDKAGATPLHWAARGGHVDCAEELLKRPNCRADVQNKLGDTPLHNAAWKGSVEVRWTMDTGLRIAFGLVEVEREGHVLGCVEKMSRLLKIRVTSAIDDDYGDSDEDED